MKQIIDSLPDQILKIINSISLPSMRRRHYRQVLLCGMGGSGISGDIAQALYPNVDIITNKDYEILHSIDRNTLAIFISYSGNTEETLTNYAYCARKGLDRVIISSNGILYRKRALAKVRVPAGLPPRGALGYLFTPIPFILKAAGMISSDPGSTMTSLARFLKREQKKLVQRAQTMSSRLLNKMVIVYVDSQRMWPVARRWQCQFNENAKVLAHINIIPEMNHNEIVGLGTPRSIQKNSVIIVLKDPHAHPRNTLRSTLLKKVVGSTMPPVINIRPNGNNSLQHMFWTIFLGDYVSYYYAIRTGVDPLPVRRIDVLKKLLAQH